MAINFPTSPSTNDTFTVGSISYKWDGAKWIGLGVTPTDRLIEGSNSLEINASNNLVWTGNNVGIKNSTPLYPLHFKNAMGSSPSFIHMEVTGSNTVGGGGGIAFDTSATNSLSNNGLYLATISGVRNSADDGSNDLVFKTSKAGVAGDDGNTHSPKERLRINSAGDIGINKQTIVNWGSGVPTIEIKGTETSGGSSVRSGAVAFESGSGNNGYAILWGNEGGIEYYSSPTNRATTAYGFKFTSGGNIAFASGKGIDFSANANAAGMTSEVLDDYEEGTWIPVYEGQTQAGTYTYTDQIGTYVKIGSLVTVNYRLTNITTSSVGSGSLNIGGLPFAAAAGTGQSGGNLRMDSFNIVADAVNLTLNIGASDNKLTIYATRDNLGDIAVSVVNKTSNSADIVGQFSYFT